MNAVMTFLPIIVIATLSLGIRAEEVLVTKARPLRTGYQLQKPTTVVLENAFGNTQVVETDGSVMSIEGTYAGDKPIKVKFEEPEIGKFKLVVEYPETSLGGVGSVVFGRNGGLNVSSIVSGGSVVISGGRVEINGRVISDGNGSVYVGDQPLHLKIGIPKSMLANLKLDSTSGNLSVIGAFQSPEAATRHTLLKTVSGDARCGQLCSLGSFTIDTTSGDGTVRAVKTSAGRLKSISGDFEIDDSDGNFEVDTTSGDVTSVGGAGGLRSKTVSGDISVRGRREGLVKSESISGDIDYRNPDPSAREEAKTLSGDITGLKSCGDAMAKPKRFFDDPFRF